MRPRYRLLREVIVEPETAGKAPAPTNTPVETPTPAPAADWRAQIPEALRGEKTWDKFKDPAAFFQSYHAMEKAQGSMVSIPGKDAKPEQVAAFREKLGVPKAASDYVFTVPEGVPALDEGATSHFRGVFHKYGIPAEAAQGIVAAYADYFGHEAAKTRQGYGEGLQALKSEWGESSFARRATLASRAVDRFGTPELKTFLDDTGLGDHPELVKLFANVGDLLAEHAFIEGRVEGVPTAEDAKRRIAEIRANPAYGQGGPVHKALHEELLTLYQLVDGPGERT